MLEMKECVEAGKITDFQGGGFKKFELSCKVVIASTGWGW